MITYIIQFVVSIIATLSFAVLFSAPKKELFFCGLSGGIGWIFYFLLLQLGSGHTLANLVGTLALTIFARYASVVRKNPITIYLISGIFPLVPGAGIYYTSYYLIMNEMESFSSNGLATIKTAGAIVLGITFAMALPQSWFNAFGRRTNNRNYT